MNEESREITLEDLNEAVQNCKSAMREAGYNIKARKRSIKLIRKSISYLEAEILNQQKLRKKLERDVKRLIKRQPETI